MPKFVASLVACVLLSGVGGGMVSAKSCRDAHGKFTKCPAPMSKHCRDKMGKFIKCPPMKKM
jgi:hypothetical protein